MKRVSRPIKMLIWIMTIGGTLCLVVPILGKVGRNIGHWMVTPCANTYMMNGEQLSLSPDGRLVAYSLQETPNKVSIVTLEGSPNPHGIARIANAKHPRFSSDSRTVVFSREEEETSHIWTIDLESGKEKQITVGNHIDDDPLFDKDNSTILFMRLSLPYPDRYRNHDSGERVYSVSAQGEASSSAKLMVALNSVLAITKGMVVRDNAIYFSGASASEGGPILYTLPTGKTSPINLGRGWGPLPIPHQKEIVFSYSLFGNSYGSAIWIMNEDGSHRRVLYNPSTSNSSKFDLALGVDGQRLLFLEDGSAGRFVNSIALDGSDAKQLFRLD